MLIRISSDNMIEGSTFIDRKRAFYEAWNHNDRMKAVLLLLLILIRYTKTTIQNYVVLKLSEYEFLKELYFNTGGPNWKNNENWDFTNYTTRNPCVQNWYGITPVGFPHVSTCLIGTIFLDDNNLIGSLPNKIENFDELLAFSVNKNHLYGSLPTFINIPHLTVINFGLNSFTGSIPERMIQGNKLKLSSINVKDNSLSGTLPDWISSLTSVHYLYLENNHFSGTLPNLSNLTALFTLAVQNNRLHGSLPSPFDVFHKIKIFQFDNNFFSGTIQSLIMGTRNGILFSATENNLEGSLPKNYSDNLQTILLTSNYLTGTIPEELCLTNCLRFFSVSDNKLRGTVPSCVWRKFVTLELDFNLFHGPIVYSKDSLQSSLPGYLSFGFNHFSGTFPVDLLYLPRLTAISASNNCFRGGFKNLNCSLISSQNLHHFYFDGLFSPFSCSKSFMEGTFKSLRSFGGTFPSCLLSKSDWGTGYFSGNGFTGTLSKDIFNTLREGANFNISRNYLTGTLPKAVSSVIWSNFDVSFNKIHGSIPKFNLTNQDGSASLILSNNRFSQLMKFPVADSSSNLYRLEISKGNLVEKGKVGKSIAYPASVGVIVERQLNVFIFLYFCILLILVIISWKYMQTIGRDGDGSALFIFMSIVALIFVLNVILLPLYYFFHSSFRLGYKIFDDSSHWKLSSLYLHGVLPPTICLFFLFTINLLLLILLMRRSKNRKPLRLEGSNKNSRRPDQIIVASLYLFVFVLNIIISVTIHIFYVMFLNNRIAVAKMFEVNLEREVLLLQMGFGLYHLLWNRYILTYLLEYLGRITGTMYFSDRWYYEYGLMLLLTNSVIGPCLSVMLKDESCFESLIYSHIEVNRVIGSIECISTQSSGLKICHRHSSFLLPFMYYHQCGSKLLVSFLPVWVYYFAFITLINYFSSFCLLSFQFLFPGNIRKYLEIFLNEARSNHQLLEIDYLFDLTFLFICVIHYPLFGIILLGKGLSQFVLSKVWLIPSSNPLPGEIEMQISQSTIFSEEDDFALATSEHGLVEKGVNGDINEEASYRHQYSQLRYSWQLLYIPALFNSVIIFDMVADEYSWEFGIGFVIGLFSVVGAVHMIVNVCKLSN